MNPAMSEYRRRAAEDPAMLVDPREVALDG